MWPSVGYNGAKTSCGASFKLATKPKAGEKATNVVEEKPIVDKKIPYARTLLDTYMDDDLAFKNTKIEILKSEANYLRGDLTAQFDDEEH